jgi:hypothetical protein
VNPGLGEGYLHPEQIANSNLANSEKTVAFMLSEILPGDQLTLQALCIVEKFGLAQRYPERFRMRPAIRACLATSAIRSIAVILALIADQGLEAPPG